MDLKEKEKLLQIKGYVKSILDMDRESLTKSIQSDPDEMVATLRASLLLLYSLITEKLDKEDE